jgi:cytochrome P450
VTELDIRGYAAARQALASPDLSRAPLRAGQGVDAHVLNMEGTDHTRHRQAVDAALGVAVAARLPQITAVVKSVIGGLPAGTPIDAADHLAYPVAIAVVDLIVGLGGPDWYAYWATVARAIDTDQAAGLLRPAYAGLAALADAARADDDKTVASSLVRSDLTHEEVAANLLFAASAGFTNLANAIGAAIQALALHPAAYSWLSADPAARLTAATDELLRYAEPALRSSTRLARRDTVVAGQRVSAGRTVRIFKADANRDPQRYAEPERLDLGRLPNPHLSFGHGRHYCPAAHLSRMVLDQVLLGLTTRFDRVEPAERNGPGWDSFAGKPLVLTFHAG